MALAVAAGAFGAHGLRERISADMLTIWHTGARYHAYHGLGLFAVAFVAWVEAQRATPGRLVDVAGWLMVGGIVIFSGSLYLLAITGVRWLGAITPIGGASWIAAWILLAVRMFRFSNTSK